MSTSHKSEFEEMIRALSEEEEDLPHLKNLGRRDRKAAETRLRLFRCAVRLFAERGFTNVTVEDITEAADVGKGTFFNYFESKDHVVVDDAARRSTEFEARLRQANVSFDSIHQVTPTIEDLFVDAVTSGVGGRLQ